MLSKESLLKNAILKIPCYVIKALFDKNKSINHRRLIILSSSVMPLINQLLYLKQQVKKHSIFLTPPLRIPLFPVEGSID